MTTYKIENVKQFLQAAKEGDIEKLKALLDQGITIDSYDNADPEKNTALHLAIEHEQLEIVELLLNHHADVNKPKSNKNESCPLHLAASHGYVKLVQMLLDHGTDINKTDKSGMTALHLAVIANHLSVIILLVLNGADMDKKNIFGTTALQTAALKRNENILKILTAYASFKFCLEETYMDFLVRLIGSSIKNDTNLFKTINSMLEVKVLMLWEKNQPEIEKNLRAILPSDHNIHVYLDYTKNLLLQCIVKRLYNKIQHNLQDLHEIDSETPGFNNKPKQISHFLKNNIIKASAEAQVLIKKVNILNEKIRSHAERLEFEEAARFRNELMQVNKELNKLQPPNKIPDIAEIKYSGILGQMKSQENLESSENKLIQLKNQLYSHAEKFEFEEAARLRDEIIRLEEDFLR